MAAYLLNIIGLLMDITASVFLLRYVVDQFTAKRNSIYIESTMVSWESTRNLDRDIHNAIANAINKFIDEENRTRSMAARKSRPWIWLWILGLGMQFLSAVMSVPK